MADEPTPRASSNRKGARLKEVVRVHHTVGGGHTDFDSEKDALDFLNDATTVKSERQPDGSVKQVFSPNAHLVHGARHPEYPDVRVEKFSRVEWPEDDE